jgi:hypothetical protein
MCVDVRQFVAQSSTKSLIACVPALWMWKCGQAYGKLFQSIVTKTFLKFHIWLFVYESDTCVSYQYLTCGHPA